MDNSKKTFAIINGKSYNCVEVEPENINGECMVMFGDGVYEGELKQGKRDGYGVMKYTDKTTYKGEWKNDRADGLGVMYDWYGNKLYEGGWEAGVYSGVGISYVNCKK